MEDLKKYAYVHLCRHLYRSDVVLPLNQKRFETLVLRIRNEIKWLVPRFIDLLETIFKERQNMSVLKRGYPGMADELSRLVPNDFLLTTPHTQLLEYPRYAKAMQIRRERYLNDPQKDLKRAETLKGYEKQYLDWINRGDLPSSCSQPLQQLRWLLEELKVSVFAQELGTPISISPRKVEDQMDRIQRLVNPETFNEKEKSKPVIDLGNLKIGQEF